MFDSWYMLILGYMGSGVIVMIAGRVMFGKIDITHNEMMCGIVFWPALVVGMLYLRLHKLLTT